MIRVRFSLSWKEYYAARSFLLRKHGIGSDKIFGSALLLLAAVMWFATGDGPYSLAALVGGLLLLGGPPLMRRLELKRKWAREPFHQTEHVITFEEDGINYAQGRVISHLDWQYYESMIESRDGFLLIYGEDIFSLIPKRAFADEQTMSEFRALATAKLTG